MASNAELTTQIRALDPAYVTDGLTNAQLDGALKHLKAAPPAADAEPPRHVVRGHAVTTRRGILSDEAEIHADDVGGIEALDALSALGIVK